MTQRMDILYALERQRWLRQKADAERLALMSESERPVKAARHALLARAGRALIRAGKALERRFDPALNAP